MNCKYLVCWCAYFECGKIMLQLHIPCLPTGSVELLITEYGSAHTVVASYSGLYEEGKVEGINMLEKHVDV